MSDGNEFAELLWENGHAVVHGRRKQPQAAFPPFTCGGAGSSSSKAQERCPGSDPQLALLKTCSAGSMAPSRHDFCSGLDATRGNGDLDDTVPWIHYPIIEEDDDGAAAADSYSPDFFSELQAAAANLNPLPPPVHVHHTANNLVRSTGAAATMAREPEPPKESRRVSVPEPQAEFAAAKQPRLGDALMNFSLFSRPAAVARASLQQISAQRPPPPLVGADKPPSVTVPASTRLWESTVVQTSSGPRTAPAAVCIAKEDVRFACAAAPTSTAGIVAHQALPQDRIADNVALAPQRRLEGRKAPEAAVTALSVCSANGAGIGDDDSCRQHKRKISQAECSASQDDDLEDESGGLTRSGGSRSTKRSRSAEVHNLSERRRRDRINEKMRALLELIPNCNKIDKASMLDEAIEYLKTLQLQVQMMSMGGGLCIPPMMLPPTMQHLQMPHMPHFPHLGMGLGYGMGVFGMNRTTTVPFPPMPGGHFPCQMIPGAAAAQGLGIPGRNTLPMFGVPGQPIHPSVSAVQPFPSLASLPVRPNMPPQVSATVANMVPGQQQVSNQQHQSLNDEGTQGASTGDPQLQTVLQSFQVNNQHFSVPCSTQSESSHFLDGGSYRTNTAVRNETDA